MRKRKGKGHNLTITARNSSYEGRKNTKREKPKLRASQKINLREAPSQQTTA